MPRLTPRADDPAAADDGSPAAPAIPPLLLTARQAAAACAVSPATWARWHSAGRCPSPVRIGGCVRWSAIELSDWCAAGCPDRRTWQTLRDAENANGRPRQAGR